MFERSNRSNDAEIISYCIHCMLKLDKIELYNISLRRILCSKCIKTAKMQGMFQCYSCEKIV
jgi:hypothetical protein